MAMRAVSAALWMLSACAVTVCSAAEEEGGEGGRARRDVDVSTLQVLVQQQASLIQTLQTQVEQLQTSFAEQSSQIQALRAHQLQSVTTCPDGWSRFHSSCYALGDEALTFGDAQEVCEWFGGSLAEVETTEENEFLKQMARARGFTGVYLGATDILTERQWQWIGSKDTLGASGTFTDWYPGQPANDGGDEDCLVLWKAYNYQWGDIPCAGRYQFICEVRLVDAEFE